MNNRYFNLNEFKSCKTATTKLGNPVKFITITGDKILVNVYHRSRIIGFSKKMVAPMFEGTVEKYHLDGRKYRGIDTEFDLVMETPKKVLVRDAKGRFAKRI